VFILPEPDPFPSDGGWVDTPTKQGYRSTEFHHACDNDDCGRRDDTVEALPEFPSPYYMCEPCRERHEQDRLRGDSGEAA